MNRVLLTEKELIDILNNELHRKESSKDYNFENVIRLKNLDKNGCNWTEVFIRGSGVPVKPILPLIDKIIFEAKKKFNLK